MLKEVNTKWDGNQGRINVAKHRIDFLNEDFRPVHFYSYQVGPTTRKLAGGEIGRVNTEKEIEPETTDWTTLILFDPKKDDSLRICVDYWKLEAIAIRDSSPIPRMDKRINRLGEAIIFSTPPAYSGYWPIEVNE